ncbi:hypothetical protein E2C06_19830 [Dankookia rubra]|uniref:Uncharacterized protein n=1 Tax=Dankookia rubra TaxID=1442381 RepID=A0A4R5QCK1_9PROT|nr:hypothetical protein [Dankookia rubra]TDH60872.1 hypothetical protein E2C06_19830 [Dankookia rubra]
MITPKARQAAAAALDRLDRLLAERPHEVHADLSEAVRSIAGVRDDLIQQVRADGSGRHLLDWVNQLVSVAVSAEFPVTGLHWDRVEKTRDGLRALLAAL